MKKERHPEMAFSRNGLFAGDPDYEVRPAQIKMASIVWRLLNQGGYGLIEAGTGTGKSLAYLYPAFFSREGESGDREAGDRLIVSTHTINLQQQLMEKEIPFLQTKTNQRLTAALLLGRGNYLCLRKTLHLEETLIKEPEKFLSSEKRRLQRIFTTVRSGLGCLEQIGFSLPREIRQLLVSETETCLRRYCPYQKDCFWWGARKRAFESQVVVVNHHLFFADLAMRRNSEFADERLVLPPYEHVIFDEAHHLEEVASEYLGLRLDETETLRFFDRLLRKDGRLKTGRLFSLRARLLEYSSDLASLQRSLGILESKALPDLLTLEDAMKSFFTALKREENLRVQRLEEKNNYRFVTDLIEKSSLLRGEVEKVKEAAERWEKGLYGLVDELQEEEELREEVIFLAESGRFAQRLRFDLPVLMNGGEEGYAHWISTENKGGENRVTINRAPLSIGSSLYQDLFTNIKSMVCTSATLAVGEEFGFLRERLGLDLIHYSEREEVILDSPFDFDRQVLLLTASDFPAPENPQFLEEACSLLPEVIKSSEGRTLVLFTNQRQMIEVYTRISSRLRDEGYNLYIQGEEPRHRLLNRFRASQQPVLFGMDSFWEGVDIPGAQLSTVVLMRLPFRVPTEPLFQARCEALAREGKDPFRHLSLPEAVIRFKQGFGRLIRTQKDRGVVVVLDTRVLSRFYGKIFLSAVPGGTIRKTTAERFPEEIASWLARPYDEENNRIDASSYR